MKKTRLILYSGKGGVGKTSLSAATAIRAAQLGQRTLVVSTDSAHSLRDALDRDVGAEPTEILPRLDAVEVDVNVELESHWGTIHEFLTRFMTFRGVDETVAEEIAILPGMEELFSLVRVAAWAASGRWDTIVIDCAPTGDTVRMLAVPEVLGFYFSRIFPIQRTVVRTVRPVAQRMTDMPIPTDDVFAAVKRIYQQMEGIGPLLQDPARSSIRIVLNPSGGSYYTNYAITDGGGNSYTVAAGTALTEDKWHHIVATYTGTTMTLYQDAEMKTGNTGTISGTSWSASMSTP